MADTGPPCVYEVNLSIQPDAFEGFLAWLKPHIRELLALDGFRTATISSREAGFEKDDSGHRLLSVRYNVASRAALQDYFDHHAERLRGDGMTRFEGKFSASRRILAVTDTITL